MTGTPPKVRARRAGTLSAAVLVILLGVSPSPASAHSELTRSDPPNGGMVAVGRSDLTLWFTETVDADSSAFDLHTLDGVEIRVDVTAAESDGGGVAQISTTPLARATYELDWRVLSLEDGHASRGSLVFGVGVRPVVVASSDGGLPATPALVLRFLDLLAIILAIGAVSVSGRVLGSMGESGQVPRRRAQFIAALAASGAVVSGAIAPLVSTQQVGNTIGEWVDSAWMLLTGTPWGHLWLWREVALLIAAGVLWSWALRRNGPRWRVQIAVIALIAAVWLGASAGHASALPRGSGLAVLASAAHLVAAGVWAGGLTVLAICLIPLMRRSPGGRTLILSSAWRTFSPLAAVSSVVLLATGLYESGRHIPGLASVTSTDYGGAVAAKVALIAAALALGGLNTLLVNPSLAARVGRFLGQPGGWAPLPPRRFTALVAAEALVLVGAVAVAAVLTSVPTAREVEAATQVTAPHSANVDGLFITFEAVPSGPDESRLIVKAKWTLKPEPAPVTGAEVSLVGPSGGSRSVALQPFELGRFEGDTAKPTPGAWMATVAVHRDGLPDAVTEAHWIVTSATQRGRLPLEIATTALALGLLTGLVGAIGFARRRHEQPSSPAPLSRERTGSRT